MRILDFILSGQIHKRLGEKIGGPKAPRLATRLEYFGLTAWWTSTFTPAERQRMETALLTSGRGEEFEVESGQWQGVLLPTSNAGLSSAAALLTILADRLSDQREDRDLACRVLAKAEERARAENDTLGLHIVYHQTIRLHCRWKDQCAGALDLAFAACHKQMRIASQAAAAFHERYPQKPLPTHLGYLQASNILEQQGAYAQAIEICRQAQSEGWNGNWSWRIQRMAKRLGPAVKPISSSGLGPL